MGIGLLAKLLHLRLRHQLLGLRHVPLRLAVSAVRLHNGLQLVLLPQHGGGALGVAVKTRLLGLGAQLLVPAGYGLQFV